MIINLVFAAAELEVLKNVEVPECDDVGADRGGRRKKTVSELGRSWPRYRGHPIQIPDRNSSRTPPKNRTSSVAPRIW